AADSPIEPEAAEVGYQEGFTEQGEPFQGDPAAPVVMEDFSSYQCPFCKRYFQESYAQVMANYVKTGQVLYVFRDFPLPTQRQSPLAAEAANCAGQIGGGSAYWAMHHQLFVRQAEWSGKGNADVLFKGYAEELELDAAAFGDCLDSGATRAQVEADAAEGGARGVRGTPTFFINGQALVGAQPYTVIAQVIDAALAGETPATPTAQAGETSAAPTPLPPGATTPFAPNPERPGYTYGGDAYCGSEETEITLAAFVDFQSPENRQHFLEEWAELEKEYVDTGKVRLMVKHFPAPDHTQGFTAAEAAECAGQQGAFCSMYDLLFQKQDDWSQMEDVTATLKGYAAELGLDGDAFATCLDEGQMSDKVTQDLTIGQQTLFPPAPVFFIFKGQQGGPVPLGQLQESIEQLLAE
ncbi:MAG: thioredoxin domain-containing protein, partial [Anaerolineae bacterium]